MIKAPIRSGAFLPFREAHTGGVLWLKSGGSERQVLSPARVLVSDELELVGIVGKERKVCHLKAVAEEPLELVLVNLRITVGMSATDFASSSLRHCGPMWAMSSCPPGVGQHGPARGAGLEKHSASL